MSTIALRGLRHTHLQPISASSIIRSISSQPSCPSTAFLLARRYASSTTSTATTNQRTKNAPTSIQVKRAQSKVNGPLSTLPPPLNLPDRAPDQPFFPTYAFSLGKAYFSFYKTSVKAIYGNFRAYRDLSAQIRKRHQSSIARAIDAGALDRQGFQLLYRTWFDVKRIPIFALVFMVCGEFTPLVVIAVTSIVPYASRIPKQIQSDRSKLESRRAISFRNLTAALPDEGKGVKGLNRMQLLHINWSLGLSSSVWDWLGGQLPGLPTPLLRRRVRRRVEYLETDDTLIKKYGGVEDMSAEEVRIALVERGVDILGRTESQLRDSMKAWLRARDAVSIERLLLTRPSVWPIGR